MGVLVRPLLQIRIEGKGLKFCPGIASTCDMATDKKNMKEKLEKELDVINRSIKGTNKIDNAATIKDIGTNNTKEDLFKIVKELFKLSKKALSHIDSNAVETNQITAEDVTSLVNTQLKEVLPGLLKDVLEKHSNSTVGPKMSQRAKEEPIETHTIIIEKEDEDEKITENEWKTVTRGDVKKTLKSIPVVKAHHTNGGARLDFNSKEDMNQAEEALRTKYRVTSKTQEKKKLNPRLTILDLDAEITSAEMLEEKLLEKNIFIQEDKNSGEKFSVLFVDKNGGGFGVLEVSPKIRETIRSRGDKVCIDLQRHRVQDRVHVIQCFHCQEHGHKSGSKFCKLRDSAKGICFYCAGPHDSNKCEKKKNNNTGSVKCANCAKSRNRNERLKCNTHKASDTLCPFYVREKLRVMTRTLGCEESKNMYLQRIKDLQRRHGRL